MSTVAATSAVPDARDDARQVGGLRGVSVALRVRSPWQALDLGTALLRRHAGVAYAAWFVVSLPFILLVLLLPLEQRWWGVALLWWLKPLFEQPVVLCLSREVFGQRMRLAAVLRSFLRSFSLQTLAALTIRRFSPMRALSAPVVLLEGASGRVRSQRLAVLHRSASRHALLANVVLANLESYVAISFTSLFVVLLPGAPMHWSEYFGEWLPKVLPIAFCLAMSLIGPLHAASGFALYINRRCDLEAWDIEVGFRGLAQRLAEIGTRYALVPCALFVGLAAFQPMPALASATAAQAAPVPAAELRTVPPVATSAADETVELRKRPGTRSVAPPPQGEAAARSRKDIQAVLDHADFHDRTTLHYPAILEEATDRDQPDDPPELPDWLLRLFGMLVEGAWWLAWAVVLFFVALAAWRYRAWLAELLDLGSASPAPPPPRIVVAGVELGTGGQSDDVAAARALWMAGEARAALAMLLRLVLTDLALRGCRFRSGDTEADCLRAAQRAAQAEERIDYLRRLLGCWVPLAYAHRPPDDVAVVRLFDEYVSLHSAAHAATHAAASPGRNRP